MRNQKTPNLNNAMSWLPVPRLEGIELIRITSDNLNVFKPLSENVLATVLRRIVSDIKEIDEMERCFLHEVADALDCPEADIKLRLVQSNGRSRDSMYSISCKIRDQLIGEHIEAKIKKGWKTEAAVRWACETVSVSRTTAYNALKAYRAKRQDASPDKSAT